jgi:hypothetical protein
VGELARERGERGPAAGSEVEGDDGLEACGVVRGAGGGDVAVVAVLEHVRAQRVALLGRQLAHQLQRDLLAEPRDHLGVVRLDRYRGDAEPPPHPVLRRAAPVEVAQLVVRDREQPHRRGHRPRLEAAAGGERGRERLRREVGGRLRIARAALEVGQQRPDVAVVEAPEVLRLARQQKRLVGVGLLAHPPPHSRLRAAV